MRNKLGFMGITVVMLGLMQISSVFASVQNESDTLYVYNDITTPQEVIDKIKTDGVDISEKFIQLKSDTQTYSNEEVYIGSPIAYSDSEALVDVFIFPIMEGEKAVATTTILDMKDGTYSMQSEVSPIVPALNKLIKEKSGETVSLDNTDNGLVFSLSDGTELNLATFEYGDSDNINLKSRDIHSSFKINLFGGEARQYSTDNTNIIPIDIVAQREDAVSEVLDENGEVLYTYHKPRAWCAVACLATVYNYYEGTDFTCEQLNKALIRKDMQKEETSILKDGKELGLTSDEMHKISKARGYNTTLVSPSRPSYVRSVIDAGDLIVMGLESFMSEIDENGSPVGDKSKQSGGHAVILNGYILDRYNTGYYLIQDPGAVDLVDKTTNELIPQDTVNKHLRLVSNSTGDKVYYLGIDNSLKGTEAGKKYRVYYWESSLHNWIYHRS